jgi:hypothetical protein
MPGDARCRRVMGNAIDARLMGLTPPTPPLRLACPLSVLLDSLTFQEKKCEFGSLPLSSSP